MSHSRVLARKGNCRRQINKCLVVLFSQMCHEPQAEVAYSNSLMEMQRTDEQAAPMLRALRCFLDGKRLVCCAAAVELFDELVAAKAGARERERWDELRVMLVLVPNQQPDWMERMALSRTVQASMAHG